MKECCVGTEGGAHGSRAQYEDGPPYTLTTTGYFFVESKFDGLCSIPCSVVLPSAAVNVYSSTRFSPSWSYFVRSLFASSAICLPSADATIVVGGLSCV